MRVIKQGASEERKNADSIEEQCSRKVTTSHEQQDQGGSEEHASYSEVIKTHNQSYKELSED